MPNNSWDAAFDAVRHNPERAAFNTSDSVRELASSVGVHEAYDSMRQQSRANRFDNQNGARLDERLNSAGATTLNFEDGSAVEAQLAGNGTPTRQQATDSRGVPPPNDSREQSVRFPNARQTESASDRSKLPVDAERLPAFESEREQQDRRLETSRRQLEVSAYSAFTPSDREVFLENMRTFEGRLGTRSPDEVARTYDALSRMISGDGITARTLSPENRYVMARDFMHHAADPTNVDQGEFSTCNVTTMQEGLLTFRPSVMADMLAQASLAGEYRSRDGRVIQLDGNSILPMADARNSSDFSNARSYATQVLNHVMANEISQRRAPPQFYSQRTRPGHNDSGERLMLGGFSGEAVLENGRPARHPVIYNSELANAMERYGQPNSLFQHSQFSANANTVTFGSHAELESRIRERIEAGRALIMYVTDTSSLRGGSAGPPVSHVISITGITADGVVRYSNQWGRHLDGEIRIEDLYRSSRPRT